MRCFVFVFTICLIVSAQIGCSGNAVSNNADSASAVQNVGNNSAAPVPEFTNDAEALAAGSKYLDDGETEKAIEALTQAVKLNPDLAEAHFKLGIAYALIEARDDTTAAETPTPNTKSKRSKEIKTNSEKSFEKAVAAYKKVLAGNDDDDAAYFNLGLAYNKLNEDEDAAKSLKEAVTLKPDNTEYQTELGSIYIKLAKYPEAVAALKKAVELDASNAKAEELLEKAVAGRKRVSYTSEKKDDKKASKSEPVKEDEEALPDSDTKPNNRDMKLPKPPAPAKSPR